VDDSKWPTRLETGRYKSRSPYNRGEALAVLRWSHSNLPHERAPQNISIGKTALSGDLLRRKAPFLKKATRGAHTHFFYPGPGRNPHRASKQP